MLYFICAFYNEAKPIINFYKLKRVNENKFFQVFENDDIKLIISGIGKINSAVALAHIVSKYGISDEDIIINIGICGSKSREIGEAVLVNKIHDIETGRDYYPDILIKHQFEEGTLETFSKPVVDFDIKDICDMEGSGFFKASSKFFSPHQIQLIKIVSDHLDGARLTGEFVEKLVEKNIITIDDYINKMKNSFVKKDLLNDWDKNMIDKISLVLNLTESQKIQFNKAYIGYKIRESKSPKFVENILNVRVQDKNESKREFKKLINKLYE
ncbi:hypothetical protein TR13x_06855 [Caloranaerobacter sp. TR13]|uniref:5'-methylthioadenosine/S-adenosylhomocysteine nucleosidase family protein n=1 Tax=Caloranaerobacter sp. TR13 TaxID=1302151 RepID=UPI0006D45996|nr:hypothetical protein [Caloranaerobacter sp. TR13]KPU27105.1 hypothetical protein TR13x_06855 [Caloranaerobacter sp. TR13]